MECDDSSFLLLRVGMGWQEGDGFFEFLCSHHVHSLFPHTFPMILAQVPHVFLKAIPNRTSNYLIYFAQNSSFLTYISKPKERQSILT
jgi:hypothetical protein